MTTTAPRPPATSFAPSGAAAADHRPAPRPPVAPPVMRLRPPALRRGWADTAGLAAWATVVVVVALWEHHGGVQDLAGGWGAAVTSLGRLTGLIASDLLLLQVLTLARIPWAERAFGQDRLARWHRLLGFTSVNLMAAHIVLITVGYALLDSLNPVGELWSLVWTAPGMLLATAGTGLLVLVSVTSIRWARRRLRYESWHLLHLYAYLGVGLALPHQLWTGADFLASTAATVYWWSLWALALVAVVTYRVVVPVRRSLAQGLHVSHAVPDGDGVVTLHVTGPRLAELEVSAGQFFVWRFLTGPGWTRGHPLSLSGAPTTSSLRVTVATTGDDGRRIAGVRPGTRVLVEGPYGRLRPEVRTRPRLVLIGSGLGVAPLVALAEDTVAAGRFRPGDPPAVLVRRVRTPGPQPLQPAVDRLVALGALRVVDLPGHRSTTGTPWLPAHLGHLAGPAALAGMAPEIADADVYVCGAAPWAEAVERDLRTAGVPASAVHVERFSW